MNFSITELFIKGGVIMYPLLVLSVLTGILIIERLLFYSTRGYRFSTALEKDKTETLPERSTNPLLRVIKVYKEDLQKGEEHCLNVGAREASRQVYQHERGLKLLATIGAIAPLVGLLGTVWGMVEAFAKIADLGEQVTPGDFASGIWTGLLTTVAGLIVAIPAVAASRLFEARVEKLTHDLNALSSHVKERYFPTEK